MKRRVLLTSFGIWMAILGLSYATAAEKTPEALEKEYEGEKNPRKRAEIARDLAGRDRVLFVKNTR